MKGVRVFLFFCIMTWATACSTTFPVTSTFLPSMDYSPLKTYDWMPRVASDDNLNETIVAKTVGHLIEIAVDRELTAKGYVKQPAGKPDFYIAYRASVEEKTEPRMETYSCGHTICSGGVSIDKYRQGTLILDIISPDTKEVIWRGSTVRTADPSQREAIINEAVKVILSQFPPKK